MQHIEPENIKFVTTMEKENSVVCNVFVVTVLIFLAYTGCRDIALCKRGISDYVKSNESSQLL